MGTYSEHIQQSHKNIIFLSEVNSKVNECFDWQVTVCFYSALHLINAHIVKKTGSNYLAHRQVEELINPENKLSVAKLEEEIFLSYNKLYHLSRRSRYLLGENYKKGVKQSLQPACLTHSKHLKKALYHLDVIISFTKKDYKEVFPIVEIKCLELKDGSLNNFKIIK